MFLNVRCCHIPFVLRTCNLSCICGATNREVIPVKYGWELTLTRYMHPLQVQITLADWLLSIFIYAVFILKVNVWVYFYEEINVKSVYSMMSFIYRKIILVSRNMFIWNNELNMSVYNKQIAIENEKLQSFNVHWRSKIISLKWKWNQYFNQYNGVVRYIVSTILCCGQ